MFDITIRTKDNYLIFNIKGNLININESRKKLFEKFIGLYEIPSIENRKNTVFNFKELKYLNSAGISFLIKCIHKIHSDDNQVEFAGLSKANERILETVGLLNQIKINRGIEI